MRHSYLLLLTLFAVCLLAASCGIFSSDDDDPIIIEEQGTVTTSRTDWKISSTPIQLPKSYIRGKILWHNPFYLTPVDEIYDTDVSEGEGTVRTFRMIFHPDTSSLPSWAGITTKYDTPIPESSTYFEFRAKGSGTIHFDFGLISEDINGNELAESEDIDHNGSLDESEDTGLDGLMDEDEVGYYPVTNPDPNEDNWYSFSDEEGKCPLPGGCEGIDPDNPIFYDYLNGTEGNIYDAGVIALPDREYFYNTFNTSNTYRTCEIDLTSSPLRIDSTEKNGWYSYRIPLRDTTYMKIVNDYSYMYPDWEDIRHIRIWFEADESQNSPDTIEFAELGFEPFILDSIDNEPVVTFTRDYGYVQRRIFDLGLPGEFETGDFITQVLLFESLSETDSDMTASQANLFVDPNDTTKFHNEAISGYSIQVKQIPPDQYMYFTDSAANKHYVVFNGPCSKEKHIGYYMEAYNKSGDYYVHYGHGLSTSRYTLKLLAHKSSTSNPSQQTWQLMWRNCYAIPKGISLDDLEIKIYKGLPGTENNPANLNYQIDSSINTNYITLLGLDQYNNQNSNIPDGIVDDRIEIFRPDWGLLIFPHRKPFDTDTTYAHSNGIITPELRDRVPALYDYNSITEMLEQSQYYIYLEWNDRE